nr:hypothetical protein [Desulfurobacterium sp.]
MVVTEDADGSYKLVAGYRRLCAVRDILGWEAVYAVVIPEVDMKEEGKLTRIQISENVKRKDLTTGELAIEVGEYVYKQFIAIHGQMDRKQFINYLTKNGVFYGRVNRVKDENLKPFLLKVCSDFGFAWLKLVSLLWLWSADEKYRNKLLEAKNVEISHCTVAHSHGISPDEFVEKYVPKIESGLSARELNQLLKNEKSKKEKPKVAGEEKVLQKITNFSSAIKRSKYVKYNPELRRRIAEELRRLADELEGM